MPARTITSAGRLAIIFIRGGDAVDRRHAADGSDAVDVVIGTASQVGDLQPGDVFQMLEAPDDLPAVSRASHYS